MMNKITLLIVCLTILSRLTYCQESKYIDSLQNKQVYFSLSEARTIAAILKRDEYNELILRNYIQLDSINNTIIVAKDSLISSATVALSNTQRIANRELIKNEKLTKTVGYYKKLIYICVVQTVLIIILL